MKKLLILPAIFFCLSFSTIHKKAEIKLFAPSAGLFLYIPSFSSAGGNPGTTGAGVLANHLDEVSIDASSENQAITLISGPTVSTSKPQIGDYVFTKSFDKSSLRLKKMLYTGSIIPNLEFRIYDGVATNPVYKIAYTNAYILSMVNNAQPCGTANCTGISEQFAVNTSGTITWTNSIPTTPQVISYNVGTNVFTSSTL